MYSKFAVLLIALIALSLSACGGSSSTGPASLNGTWKSDSPSFTAHISNNQIEIDMTGDGSSALYWKGTMPSSMANGAKTLSVADKQALDAALMGSGDDTKQFIYKDGKLQFPFRILGTTQTVELTAWVAK